MEEDHRERSKEEGEDEGEEEGGETQRRTWKLTDLTVLASNKPVCFSNGFELVKNDFRQLSLRAVFPSPSPSPM